MTCKEARPVGGTGLRGCVALCILSMVAWLSATAGSTKVASQQRDEALLAQKGERDRTVIVFTSDNGYFFGEHGLSLERRLPYEESIRNPLLIRYPAVAASGARFTPLALSADIAPTVLELTGTPVGRQVQGRSLVPLLRGITEGWRTSLLVEFYTHENPMPWLMDMDYRAVRTDRDKLHNRAGDPALGPVRGELQRELGRLAIEAMGLGAVR